MTFVHAKSSRLLLGSLGLSGYLREWEHTTERELADTTVLLDGGHRFIPGLDNGSLSLAGLLDNDPLTGTQDATLDAALGASAGSVITAAPDGLALGKRIISIEARESSYTLGAQVTDAVSFSSEWMAEGQVDVGAALHDLTAETANGNGSSVDNTASTANGGVGALHVTAYSGLTNIIVKVQHSVDDSVWVDLITFTTATAVTSQRTAVTGTVNRYLRALWTVSGTGSATFAAAFARR